MQTLGSVLAVGADEGQQQKLRKALSGATFTFVRSGRDAIEVALQSEPTVLLVMDTVEVSDSSGAELLRHFARYAHAPVVFVSGNVVKASLAELKASLAEEAAALKLLVAIDDGTRLRSRLQRVISRHAAIQAFGKAYDADILDSVASASELTEAERGVLERIGFPVDAQLDPTPIAKGAARYTQILSESLTTGEAAKRLGVNASRIRQRLTSKPPQLYGIQRQGEWRLPAFQFAKGSLIPNIETVIASLPAGIDAVAVDSWFRLPNADLEHGGRVLSPLEWLVMGLAPEPVAALAEDL